MPGTRHGGGGWWKWRNIRFSGPSRPEIARTGLQSRSKLLAHHRFYEFQSIECSENRILRIARVIHRFTAIQVSNLLRHASYHNRREESTHSTLLELGLRLKSFLRRNMCHSELFNILRPIFDVMAQSRHLKPCSRVDHIRLRQKWSR